MPPFTRRETLVLGLGAGLSVTVLDGARRASATVSAPSPAPAFTLLLVNDIYNMSAVAGRGGFAKLAAVVKAERARGVPTLFCHAGDTFSPSLMSGLDKGAHIVELTNLVAPDVFVPGNHEFDFGPDIYFERMRASKYPYFAANMRRADGSPVPGMRDTTMVSLGPVKVGIVGLALSTTPKASQPGADLRFLPEVETLRVHAAALRKAGADILVCVAHAARPVDEEIVRSGLVDVLLSGHDHDLAIEFAGKTVMVESSFDAHYVTAVDFAVAIKGEGRDRKVSWEPSFRVHDTTIVEPDPEVSAAVARLEHDLGRELDISIGTTTTELDSRTVVVRSQETAMGDLVADALRASTGADVALTNGGGLRGNKVYPAGTQLTRRDILSELPFGNTSIMVKLKGAELQALLENGVALGDRPAGRFPQVSGLRFTFDPAAPAGSRVSAVEIGGASLAPDRHYTVASNNFMLAGGDGYGGLSRGKIIIGETDGKLLANLVMGYVRTHGTIDPKVDGRITRR